jgi:hypothetical protein
MLKKNVFLIGVRQRGADGQAVGAIEERVVCSTDDVGLRKLVEEAMPGVQLITLTSLVQLEARAKKIMNVLSGADTSWPIMIDPALNTSAAGKIPQGN